MYRKNYTGCAGHDFSAVRSKTEKYGYIPAKKRIENLMLAGKRLTAFNAGLYMYNAGSMDSFSAVDQIALGIPFYNDELSLMEKKAYLSGLAKAKAEVDARTAGDQERLTKNQERFDRLIASLEGRTIEAKPKEDAPSETV